MSQQHQGSSRAGIMMTPQSAMSCTGCIVVLPVIVYVLGFKLDYQAWPHNWQGNMDHSFDKFAFLISDEPNYSGTDNIQRYIPKYEFCEELRAVTTNGTANGNYWDDYCCYDMPGDFTLARYNSISSCAFGVAALLIFGHYALKENTENQWWPMRGLPILLFLLFLSSFIFHGSVSLMGSFLMRSVLLVIGAHMVMMNSLFLFRLMAPSDKQQWIDKPRLYIWLFLAFSMSGGFVIGVFTSYYEKYIPDCVQYGSPAYNTNCSDGHYHDPPNDGEILFHVTYAIGALFAIICAWKATARAPQTWAASSVALLVLGLICRAIDKSGTCFDGAEPGRSRSPFQGVALYHIFFAAGLGCMYGFWRQLCIFLLRNTDRSTEGAVELAGGDAPADDLSPGRADSGRLEGEAPQSAQV